MALFALCVAALPVLLICELGLLFWNCLLLFDAFMFTTSVWTVIILLACCLDHLPETCAYIINTHTWILLLYLRLVHYKH